jgi:FG-GAP repeat
VRRMIERVLLATILFAMTGFVLLVLIGLWDRYEKQAKASGFNEADGRFLAPQAVSPRDSDARSDAIAEHAPHVAVARDRLGSSQVVRQEAKPASTHAFEGANQGISVALSADGSTAILGGPGPHNADLGRSPLVGPAGAAWVFTRSHGIWTQQGNKLVGATSEYGGGLWSQGASVALSADGNTAIVGGPSDNKTRGAAWVFTRTGGAWTQQGDKLVGSDAYRMGEAQSPRGQGMAVALSADGNTALAGGWGAEAAWVFTRNGSGAWTQEGKLVGDGAVGRAHRGMSVALSADGNTAIVGGWSDNSKTGAAWVFSRSRGVWTQQGKKLVGSGAVGSSNQGWSVALSADGNTAIVGGPSDNMWDPSVPFGLGAAGAAWVFSRSGSGWTQEGEKLVSTRSARQGMSVALSADGNIAIVGGLVEDGGGGGGLVFARNGGQWTLDKKLVSTSAVGKSAPSVALSADGTVIMVGGPNDNGGIGAAWVFSRSGGGWSQDKKLIGNDAIVKSTPSVAVSTEDGR